MNNASWLARLMALAIPIDITKTYGFRPGIGWIEIEGEPVPGGEPTVPINWATTTKILSLDDRGTYIRSTNASASTLTIPPNSDVAFNIGTEIPLSRRNSSTQLTIVQGSGVTVNPPANGTLVLTNRMSAMLKKVATNEWDLIGQTVPE